MMDIYLFSRSGCHFTEIDIDRCAFLSDSFLKRLNICVRNGSQVYESNYLIYSSYFGHITCSNYKMATSKIDISESILRYLLSCGAISRKRGCHVETKYACVGMQLPVVGSTLLMTVCLLDRKILIIADYICSGLSTNTFATCLNY